MMKTQSNFSKDKKIGGHGFTVEIDESVFAKRKYNRGRKVKEQWVFGGICRETKERFLELVPNRKKRTLVPIILKRIAPGTVVMSDSYASYKKLSEHFEHHMVNHSLNFVDPEDKTVHTQNVERMWRPYKDDNRRRAGTHRHMIGSYMAEYMWRVSMEKDADIFEEILKAIKEYWPPGKKVRELTFYEKMNDTGDFNDENDVSTDDNDVSSDDE